ncbi:MAG: 2-C-methyl-D-erythritol 4-phosphate cytidylyltransferase [Bacteroidales bacterium]|nr:2-C-methyl-D-erythritol 4-phosphate cytidylyltransferase [Bacteroidales bacterium]
MKEYLIIVAGGIGKRFDSKTPKQFLNIAGRPLLMHTILGFYNYSKEIEIFLVLPQEYFEFWKNLCFEYKFEINHRLVEGGSERFYSVKNALKFIPDKSFVAIHDGVRPLVDQTTINKCFSDVKKFGNAIPVSKINDSIRQISEDGKSYAIDRTKFRIIQTPQTFYSGKIKQAYLQEFDESFTDDASVLEKMGEEIHLIEGNSENIKITKKTDLRFAETLLKIKNNPENQK